MSDESSQAAGLPRPVGVDPRGAPPGSASGSATPTSGPTAPTAPAATATPGSRYTMGTFPNMIRSMVVIGAFVLLLLAIVPRVSSVEQPAVDAEAKARYVATQAKLPLAVAVGLPSGWKAITATYGPSEGLPTWQVSYLTPSGGAIALKQAQAATPLWLASATSEGVRRGSQTVAGQAWEERWSPDKDRVSLVLAPAASGGSASLTTVVTGTAPLEEVRTLAAALQTLPVR